MVVPRRGNYSNAGHTMRSGIDTWQPDEVYDAGQLGGAEVMARVLGMIEAARPEWHDRAACKGSALDFTSNAKAERAACLQVCGTCPVMAECRAWSLTLDDKHAVLGGLDPQARALLKKRQRQEDHRAET